MLTVQEAPLQRGYSIGQQSAPSAGARRLLSWLCSDGAQDIGAADNAHNASVAQHRCAFDAVSGEQPSDFADLHFFADGDYRSGHDVVRPPLRGAEAPEEIGAERFALCEQSQPPVSAGLAIHLVAANEVALAYHADRRSGLIHDGHCANTIVAEDFCNFGYRRLRTDRHYR
jgi:hypothetical protein